MGLMVLLQYLYKQYLELTWKVYSSKLCTALPKKIKKKLHTLMFCWTTFNFNYSMYSPWHCFDKLCKVSTFISVQSCNVSPRSCVEDGRGEQQLKFFSSTSQRFSMGLRLALCGGQFMCENGVSCSLSQLEPDDSWHCCLEIFPSHQGRRKNPLMGNPGHSVFSGNQLTSFQSHAIFAEPRPDQEKQPQISTLLPKACTVGTMHDGCIASCASLLHLMYPCLWDRVNLDVSDHMTFFSVAPESNLYASCSKRKPFL